VTTIIEAMARVTRDSFARTVIDVVRAKFPLVKITRAEDSFSLRVNGHVASLENLYRVALLSPNDMQHNIERWAVELIRAAEGSPDDGAPYEDLKERILPMVLSQCPPEPTMSKLHVTPLVPGLQVGYAIDNDRTITYVAESVFKRWNVKEEQLHNRALKNLVARSEAIHAQALQDESGKINLILFQTNDGFDASRILLPTLHERLREYLGSPFTAAIPNRDILLCFRDEEQTVEKLRSQIEKDYRQMPNQVTDQLLLITPDGIAPHD
jgi:hypothetical protein